MTSDWKECIIGDVCNSVSETYKGNDEQVVLINTSDVLEGAILNHCAVDNKNLKGQFKKTFQKNDILYSEIRPANKRFAFVNIEDTNNYIASTKLMVIRPNLEMILPEYLYMLLKSQSLIDELQHLAETRSGTFPQITFTSELAPMQISLPPLETQRKIARVLRAIDDKIELNNAINKNLEQQMDLLYTNMFIDDTNFVELGSVIETTSGGTPSRKNLNFYKNGTINWIKSKELLGTYIIKTEEYITDEAVKKSSAKILPKQSVLVAMYGATVGAYGIISKEMTCNQAICALIQNERYPYPYIFETIKFAKNTLVNMAVGSAQQNISQILIKQLPVHSNLDKIKKYCNIAELLLCKILNIQEENSRLTQLRDTLLPKLMNGEIDVDKVEINV